jgi:hypothetical protein
MKKQPRGRPPSYPTIVTTSSATNASSASGLSSPSSSLSNNSSATALRTTMTTSREHERGGGNAYAGAVANITVKEALRLYKRDGNALAALEAFRSPDEQPASQGSPPAEDTADPFTATIDIPSYVPANDQGFPVMWHWHNQAVLEYITCSSKHIEIKRGENKDADADADDELANNLSTMLLIQGILAEAPSTRTDTTSLHSNAESMIARRYDCLVIMHNKCLHDYANGKYREARIGALIPFTMAKKSIKVDSNGVVEITNLDSNSGATAAPAEYLDKKNAALSLGFLFMTTRLAFLLMDCHLALHSGDGGAGLGPITDEDEAGNHGNITITMEDIIIWIEKNPLYVTSILGDTVGSLDQCREWFQHGELKFRLHLYRSKTLFVGASMRDDDDGNDTNSRLRISRKELKNAMDIYQNKLAIVDEEEMAGKGELNKRGMSLKHDITSNGVSGNNGLGQQELSETTSVTSMAGGSFVTSTSDAIMNEVKGGGGTARATFEGMPTKNQPQSSDVQTVSLATVKAKTTNPSLQSQHELVLYLKANLEYLRGNTSKSLKLCAEARSVRKNVHSVRDNDKDLERACNNGPPQDNRHLNDTTEWERQDATTSPFPDSETRRKSDYGDAIYYNNLALLHQSAGKMYLALQYYSYALSYMQKARDGLSQRSCWSNGVVCPDLTSEILSNKSHCAFHTQEFHTAYTCMAQCVKLSPFVFGKRARCWLRLAQSCIGEMLAIVE